MTWPEGLEAKETPDQPQPPAEPAPPGHRWVRVGQRWEPRPEEPA